MQARSLTLGMLYATLTLLGHLDNPCEAKSKKKSKSKELQKPAIATTVERDVMLISAPKHTVEIRDEATIAFIEFDHVIPYKKFKNMNDLLCVSQVSSALAQHLADLNKFRVVTRENIESVIKEVSFGHSGNVNSETSAELGELIGADILIYGKVQLCTISKPDITAIKDQENEKFIKSLQIKQAFTPNSSASTNESIDAILRLGTDQAHRTGHHGLAQNMQLIGQVAGVVGNLAKAKKERKKAEQTLEAQQAAAKAVALAKVNGERESYGKIKSLILARVQLIEASTGRQIFTTSLRGEYYTEMYKDEIEPSDQELYSHAVDNLANDFIDSFLARRKAKNLPLYANKTWGFDQGIDLIQLGDCHTARAYFNQLYQAHRDSIGKQDLAKLMYNQGIAAMCANDPEAALDKLWASLRLVSDYVTFRAIDFTNDIIDRGREIRLELDPVITDIRNNVVRAGKAGPQASSQ